MTAGRVILVHPSLPEKAIQTARKGAVFHLHLYDPRYPPELRDVAPRVRLLEDGNDLDRPIRCELIDEWPDAPAYYPPERDPNCAMNPFSVFASEQRGRRWKETLVKDSHSDPELY